MPSPVTCKNTTESPLSRSRPARTSLQRTYRIPPSYRREPAGPASGVRPLRDVVQRARRQTVQQLVQEPQGGKACRDALDAEERDDACERRRARARAVDAQLLPGDDDGEADALCGDVGEPASGRVEQSGEVRPCDGWGAQVRRDGRSLVGRCWEKV